MTAANPGLEGVVAAETRLSSVDGQAGELIIAGFPLEAFADRASFEETIFALWNDRLPAAAELERLRGELAARRELPALTVELLRGAAREKVAPMDALRMAAGTLHGDEADPRGTGLTILAQLPTIVASYWRLLQGQEPVAPDPALGHAANFLLMLRGEAPGAEQVRGLETYLNTVVDHGLNASTFTARVITSTQSDLVSAITGAIGALKGPLHGGAPGPALDMVFEIGAPENAEAYLRAKLARGERLMGFGHRIYKVRDPRAEVLGRAARQLYQTDGDTRLYDLTRHVEETAVRLLAEHKPGRNLQTNVEFYTALLLYGLGLPTELFTPVFTIGRAAGWLAHCFEQQAVGRIIRPQSVYEGPRDRQWVAVGER
ncbi:MAG TPA: citrate synthase/methylcitrate synthase [Herpetosiphonaceae bacterium]